MSLSSWRSLFRGYSFNEVHHSPEFEFIQRRSIFFSLSVLCVTWLRILGFIHIPNYVLSFSMNKRQLLICLHPATNKWQLPNFRCLKNYHLLAFWRFIPQYQSWSQACLSPPTHTWPIEDGGFLIPMLSCTNRKGWRETTSLSTADSSLPLKSTDGRRVPPPSFTTRRMYEGVIFPRQHGQFLCEVFVSEFSFH